MKINLNSKSKKRIILAGLSSAIAILIVAVSLFSVLKTSKSEQIANPELARAMEYGELTEKDEETQSEYVRFSAYFARDLDGNGYAEKVKGTCKEVEGEDTLYMSLNVLGNGVLKNAKIEIEEDNMYFKTALVDDETISGNYISENTKSINLKEVQAGTQKLIFGQVRSGDYRYNTTKKDAIGKDANKYSGINKIKLTGTHVKDDGTETKIEKEIEVPVDWYSTTKAEIPYTYGANGAKNKYQNYNTESIVDEENKEVNLEFKIVSQESNNKLLLAKSTIEGTIPELNGYKATKVEITGENVEYTYNDKNGEFTAYREAKTTESGNVTKEAYTSSWNTARYSEFKLKVTYPLEAYEQANGTIVLSIPVKATFEGYNNDNDEFDNPYISNIAEDVITVTYERGGGDVISYDVQVGTWLPSPYNVYVISKENAVKYYNNDDSKDNDTYEVRWYVSRGNSGTISNVQLKEQDNNYTDKFQKSDGTYEDMLKYSKNIGIYFTTPGAMFGENGWIKVYNDETDELIHEFTSKDWETYTKENPYYYEEPVNHIRIETSDAEKVSSFTAVNIKELDNEQLTTDKTREEFDKLSKIYSYLSGYAKYSEDEDFQKLKDDVGIANYDEPLSMAQINNITPTTLSTQETTNMKISIGTVNLGYNVKLWKNGTFLLKFPQEVLLAEINDVSINNGNVSILGYDIYEKDGNYYLKILTENENPENYTITVDVDVTPDPRKLSATRDVELWAYNEECNNYKDSLRKEDTYDINGDGNTKDIVNYSKKSVQFVGPTSLLTTETASDYNDEGDELKTTVAPQVAVIDKTQKNKTAKISVQITNNYSGNISGVVLVGKTPFKGNTSQILGKDLGSTFTAEMKGAIELPEKLQGIATVYYSENENVNNNINDESNNWKTEAEVTDFSKIRTYAIDLGDYQIQKGEEYICTYEIQVPQDVNYNDVTYSSHAVYFYLETDEGKLQDQTETNKLGFMIARKYDLEISKVKRGTGTAVQGASFSVQAEGEENSRIVVSDSKGKINITDLYVGKVYTVKELKAPSDYVLNGEEVKFTTDVDENGDLQVEKISGSSDIKVSQATEKSNAKVSFTVVNEPKYTLKLTKEDQNGNKVQGVRFNLTGKGLPEAGRTVSTNSKGELTITGLYPNEEYTLTEVYAEGYVYSEAPIKFKTVWNGNNLEAQVIEGSFKELPTVDNNQAKQPIMSASLVNEKLDEYYLTLGKFEKETPNPLEGALFTVKGKWLNSDYTTDEYGTFEVGPLYVGIEYTIEEVVPPTGYALSNNKVRFIVNENEEGKQQLQILEGEIKPSADFESEEEIDTKIVVVKPEYAIDKNGNSMEDKMSYAIKDGDKISQIEIAIDNEPLFSLTKVDGDTQEPLPNVKFAITKVEDDGTETQALNSKGEVIGETTEIDGKSYQVITTDEDGRITEDLPEGYYKVVEVETLEGYQLPENEEDRTYFFGIGKTKPAVKEIVELWSQTFEGNGQITYTDSVATDDGGYVKVGYFKNSVKFNADETENGEKKVLMAQGSFEDGVIIKFNSDNKIEWAKTYKVGQAEKFNSIIRCSDGNYLISGLRGDAGTNFTFHIKYDQTGNLIEEYEKLHYNVNGQGEKKILETNDGGFIAIENFSTAITFPAENTVNNQEIVIETNGSTDGLLIKYNSEHKVEWARSIGGKQADTINDIAIDKNGNIVIVGQFTYNSTENYIKIPAEETVNKEEIILTNAGATDSFIVKYTTDGLVEWADNPGGTGNYEAFKSICINQENKYLIFGYLGNTVLNIPSDKTANGQSINVKGTSAIIQYNGEGKIEWAEGYMTGSNGYSAKIANTSDDGYIQVGLVNTNATSITADQTANNQEIKLTSNGQRDYLVLKFNKDNKVEWASQFGSIVDETDANIKSLIELPNNRYLVQVYLTAKATIPSDKTTLGKDLELLGNVTLIYNSDGLIEYASSEVNSSSQYNSVVATDDGGQIAVGQMTGSVHVPADQTSTGNNIDLLTNGNQDMLITKYNSNSKIDWMLNIGGISNIDLINKVEKKDDTYIAVGQTNGTLYIDKKYTYTGESMDITNSGTKGVIIQFTEEGKIISAKLVLENVSSIANTEDGGYIVTGSITRNSTISAENTENGQSISLSTKGNNDAIILKYNSENKVEWYSQIGGKNSDLLNQIIYANGEYTTFGIVQSQFEISSNETENGEAISINDEIGGIIVIRYNENGKIKWAKEIADKSNASYSTIGYLSASGIQTNDNGFIIVGKQFNSTLTISEEDTVENKEITIIGNGAHGEYIIKFNQEGLAEWGYRINGYGNLDPRNIYKSDDDGFVLIGHGDGGLNLNSDKTVSGEEISTREPGGYIIKYNNDEKVEYVKIISNANTLNDITENNGIYTVTGYNKVNGVNVGYIGKFQENTISAEIPEQQELTIENYKKEYKITTDVDGVGGTISGQGSTNDNPYETVEDGGDSTKDIVITPEPGYKVLEITVNGEKIEFTPEEDGSVILNKFVNMTSDKHVVVKFSNSVSTVIVHHYKDGTTDKLAEDETLTGEIGTNYTTAPKDIADYEVVIEKLPSNASGQYTEAEQEVIYYYKQIPVKLIVHHYLEGTEEIVPGSEDDQINEERERNSEYTTSPATDIDAKYELVATPINSKGKLTENETVVTYYYRVKDSAGVIVHHIDTDTKEEIAPDVIIPATGTAKYGDSYTTEISKEIPANYEYVSKTDNWEGTMIDKLTEVTYEYKLVDPTIRNGVGKTATLEITSKDDEITYDIAYRATIENYIGKAQVTIVDTIPYAIDMSKSTLDGGTYNAKTNTITWKEVVNGIDTYANPESGEILINKTIKVVYTNLDTTQETIVNNVSGQVKLLTPEKTSEKVTDKAETLQNYKVNVTVNKVWADNETQAQRRPEKIKFTVTANGKDTQNTYEMNVASESSYTFTNLDKYDSEGNTITYGIKETVIDGQGHEDDLKFYETSETKNELDKETGNRVIEITNTFKKPTDKTKITVTKEWKDENNKNKKRPENVTIQVSGNGTTEDVTLSEDNKIADNVWQTQVTKPVYNDNGEEIEYTADEKDVPKYYEKTLDGLKVTNTSTYAKVITHYYIDGTTDKVPTKDGNVNEDTIQEGNIGDNYKTTPTEDIPDYYELVQEKLPENAEGTMNGEVTEVTYYYKLKEYEYTVNYFYDGVKDESKTDKLTATYGEQIKDYTDKVKPGYAFEKDEHVPLTITSDPSKNVINVYYKKADFSYTVEYYYDNVKDENATESYTATYQDVIKTYEDKLKDGYRFDKTENLPLTITEVPENNVIKVYYVRKDTKVIVKYLEKGTNKVLDESANYEIPGKVFDEYETEQKEFTGYNFVESTNNTKGTMTEEVIEVIYYYELKTPNAEQNISKTATETIESLGDKITYNITYTANVIDYMGEVEVTIVDTLPFAIDTAKSDLSGGTYNEKDKTITWKETVSDINSYENRNNNIEITKTITVVYKDLKQGTTKIENKVSGNIKTKTPAKDFGTVEAKAETGTKFTLNIPVSKIWDDDTNKLGNRPTSVIFKLTGSDGSVYTKEISVPGTAGSTTTQDSENPNKWNDIFENLPKYDSDRNEIEYTLTEEEKEEGDLQFYETTIDNENKTITNRDKYGKVTVHYYIIDNEGKKTTNRVPDKEGNEVPDIIIEGQEGDKYETEPAEEVSEKYELVQTELPENADGTIEKYNPEKEQVVIYYYRLKPAKVIINYLEKDEDNDDKNNQILSPHEEIDGYVDDKYNTDEKHKKETITKDGKKYTLVEDSGNTKGTMTVEDTEVTYYYLQNTKATVRYVARDPETHEITKELEEPYTEEGLVGDEFVTNEKAFIGYKLVEAPKDKTIQMTKDEQVLIYYYEPVYTGLVENHIDIINGNVLYTEIHEVQVGDDYNIPSKEFAGYDLVEEKLPDNSTGTMGEELVTVNYYYIKKAVLEVNYIDQLTGKPLADQIIDNSRHEGDKYETEQKDFDGYDFVKVEGKPEGTMQVEVDEDGNIVNNKTVVTYYYAKKAQIEEHHIDIRTGKELEEPIVHNGHVGDEYKIPSKEFLSYEVVTKDEDGKDMLPENAEGKYTEEKQVVTYYYYQPAKVIVHYVDMTTNEELQETNKETGKVQSSQVVIEGSNQVDYETEAKEFSYYTLVEKDEEGNSLLPENAEGKMKVEITKDEEGKTKVNNIIDVYYYYEPKPFNIGVEKEITGIAVNGERRTPTNGKLEKVEIYRKSTESTSVQVEYKIKVSNTGEVSGNATIEENIPEGMSLANNDGTWEEQEGKLIKVIPEIGAGETKEYTVLLNWEQTGENMGEKANEVKLVETGNVPGFVDNNDKDNTSNANVIISVETGELPIGLMLALVALVGLETVTLRYAVILTKRQKKNR